MKKLSLVTHYYNTHDKAQHLLDHLASFPDLDTSQWEIVVVDDCSQTEQTLNKHGLNVRHMRVIDDIPWNQAGARNLGALIAEGTWGLFFDIDQELSEFGLRYLLGHVENLQHNAMFYMKVEDFVDSTINEKLTIHPNTFLVHMPTFRDKGMYDEDFAGNYGYEDLYLPYQWERHGGVRLILGEESFFTDKKFRTPNLERNLEPNKLRSTQRLMGGLKKPKNMIRFEWTEISL